MTTIKTYDITTAEGARQGCKIGALIFSVIYEYALKKVRQRARDAGLVLLVEAAAGQCPWRISPEALPASPAAAPRRPPAPVRGVRSRRACVRVMCRGDTFPQQNHFR